ncbi:hypothetical protein [Clostridium felsineum]|uniref:Uncharacterized protein n=1 Tax=Clostridium felsineum TaxID=36839 RepID=A0A1S8M9F1_9CLOT|nr:hypothetical protein [Clostridium felsineum]URZ08463.1 hypothetical protein CLROS_038450 [Clostridium felsineum]URZ13494.1 hypothetical protein CROST_042600 [Clostridium felsineum]
MKKGKYYITTIIGLLLIIIGLYFSKSQVRLEGILKVLLYICIGLGCGIFGQGMGKIVSEKAVKNYLEIKKQIEIDTRDERNIAIMNKAKAKAYDMMIFVFGAVMFALALMGIDLMVVMTLVIAYLFVALYGIYCRCKYDKEM